VEFVVDLEGNKGKTWFQQYMLSTYPDTVQILTSSRVEDMAFAIDVQKCIFLINVPRDCMQFFQYRITEMLKDRLVFSSKYESFTKIFRTNVHVIVFCNEAIDFTKISVDRVKLTELH
jgi:hypothetical protein